MSTESTFKEGTRVAVQHGGRGVNPYYSEHFVEKVYKNGNFILKGDPHRKQWCPYGDGVGARQTGNFSFGGRPQLKIWDETTDAEIAAANERQKRRDRMWKIKREVEHMHAEKFTDEVLEAFERALVLAGVKIEGQA